MCQIQWMSQSSGQVSWRRRVCRFVPMTSRLSSRSADQWCNDSDPRLLYLRPVKGMAAVFFYFVSSRSPEVRTYHRWVLKDPPLHCYPCHAVSAEVQYHTNGQMNLDTNTNSGLNVNMLEYFAHVYCLLMKRTISMWFAVKLTINPYPLWGMRNTPPHFSSLYIFQSNPLSSPNFDYPFLYWYNRRRTDISEGSLERCKDHAMFWHFQQNVCGTHYRTYSLEGMERKGRSKNANLATTKCELRCFGISMPNLKKKYVTL